MGKCDLIHPEARINSLQRSENPRANGLMDGWLYARVTSDGGAALSSHFYALRITRRGEQAPSGFYRSLQRNRLAPANGATPSRARSAPHGRTLEGGERLPVKLRVFFFRTRALRRSFDYNASIFDNNHRHSLYRLRQMHRTVAFQSVLSLSSISLSFFPSCRNALAPCNEFYQRYKV